MSLSNEFNTPAIYPITCTETPSKDSVARADFECVPPKGHKGYLVTSADRSTWYENCAYFPTALLLSAGIGGKVLSVDWVTRRMAKLNKGVLPENH